MTAAAVGAWLAAALAGLAPLAAHAQGSAPGRGNDGKGGHGGGIPLVNARKLAFAADTVRDGRNNMPSFGTQLSAEQIRAVSGYIVNDLTKQAAQ
jgi:mono/diheme cytochrome c family protein